jgi:mycoredoxin
MDDTTNPTDETSTPSITMYWRPGCPFCSSLRAGLRQSGLTVHEVDIWKDDDARAFVRSVANGNETVPTVTVGSTSLVNPSAKQVLALVEAG